MMLDCVLAMAFKANNYQSSVNLHILAQKHLQINQKLPASGK